MPACGGFAIDLLVVGTTKGIVRRGWEDTLSVVAANMTSASRVLNVHSAVVLGRRWPECNTEEDFVLVVPVDWPCSSHLSMALPQVLQKCAVSPCAGGRCTIRRTTLCWWCPWTSTPSRAAMPPGEPIPHQHDGSSMMVLRRATVQRPGISEGVQGSSCQPLCLWLHPDFARRLPSNTGLGSIRFLATGKSRVTVSTSGPAAAVCICCTV